MKFIKLSLMLVLLTTLATSLSSFTSNLDVNEENIVLTDNKEKFKEGYTEGYCDGASDCLERRDFDCPGRDLPSIPYFDYSTFEERSSKPFTDGFKAGYNHAKKNYCD